MSNLKDIVVDCADAWAQANWWAETLGCRLRPHTAKDMEALRAEGIKRREDDPNLALDPIDEPVRSMWFRNLAKAIRVAEGSGFAGPEAERGSAEFGSPPNLWFGGDAAR